MAPEPIKHQIATAADAAAAAAHEALTAKHKMRYAHARTRAYASSSASTTTMTIDRTRRHTNMCAPTDDRSTYPHTDHAYRTKYREAKCMRFSHGLLFTAFARPRTYTNVYVCALWGQCRGGRA